MPITFEDVKRVLGPNSVVDLKSVCDEIARRFPLGGEELTGIRKDMTIKKIANDILEQPQISGQSKWEDRFLFGKGMDASSADIKSWVERSTRALSVQPREYKEFFTWLKGFDNCPWQIEGINDLHKTLKVFDKGKEIMHEIPFESAMNFLRKSLGWSDADVFEYWDWKKSMFSAEAETLFREVNIPGGYRLYYTPENEADGYVEVSKVRLAQKSYIEPSLRGREVTVVTHHHPNGQEVELGTHWGMDAPHESFQMAKKFANDMVKGFGGNPCPSTGPAHDGRGRGEGMPGGKRKGIRFEKKAEKSTPATQIGQDPHDGQLVTSSLEELYRL